MEELQQSLGIPMLGLYPILERLREEGVVERAGDRYGVRARPTV